MDLSAPVLVRYEATVGENGKRSESESEVDNEMDFVFVSDCMKEEDECGNVKKEKG